MSVDQNSINQAVNHLNAALGWLNGTTQSQAAAESAQGAPASGASGEAAPFTLKFGKHKGKTLDLIPVDYLRWLLEQPNNDPQYQKAYEYRLGRIRAELERREGDAGTAIQSAFDADQIPF